VQAAIGGPVLSRDFWRRLVGLPCTVAIKVALFHQYHTLNVALGVADSDRRDEVTLYTGNDDHIPRRPARHAAYGPQFPRWPARPVGGVDARRRDDVRAGVRGSRHTDRRSQQLTDANAAVFDAAHHFRGCVAGVHEVLCRQSLLAGTWCLDADEGLSPGQAKELTRVSSAYPRLTDDDYVVEHRDDWRR
jgi:hypothetical protein